MTWQDKPDSAGLWLPRDKHGDRMYRHPPALLSDEDIARGNYLCNARWLRISPDIPPLKPGLLRWNLLGNRGDGVLWPNGEVTLLRESFQVLFCGEKSCRTAGYTLTQD